MKAEKADMGILILDADPTEGMEGTASKAGQLEYQLDKSMPPKHYDKVQIITAYEIIEGAQIGCPPYNECLFTGFLPSQMTNRVNGS